MATTRVLLLGGHGKISMKLTPMLLAKSFDVTSVVRNEDHKSEILSLGKGQPGKVDVLVDSLDDISKEADAKRVLDKVNPSIVVWSAGKETQELTASSTHSSQEPEERVVPAAPRQSTKWQPKHMYARACQLASSPSRF